MLNFMFYVLYHNKKEKTIKLITTQFYLDEYWPLGEY